LKYGLHLVGYPRKEICDPSNLTVNELFALQESLQKGTCSFKRLPDADKSALQLMVDEQERNGENPWGKRKRQDNTSKPKKKRKTNPHPPSEISAGLLIQETHSTVQSDSDHDDTSNGDAHKSIHKPTLKAANPAVVRGKCLPLVDL
jgi:hypothetical protein